MSESIGIFASVKRLGCTLLSTAQTRLELLANEIEENQLRMKRLFFLMLLMFFFFFIGVILLTLLILAMFWDTYRLLAVGVIAVAYLGIAGCLALYVLRELKHRPKLFSVTIAELIKDRVALESDV